jgi:uncharacterized protein
MSVSAAEARLIGVLDGHDALAIAVSGGVDSMTLAYVAHRFSRASISMLHAVSPAVPAHATERVRAYATQEGWSLTVVDAGEFDDPRYRANPLNRCYYCKSNLYDRIASSSPHSIASGTNLDDLDDYRPGLLAASERSVVHPFVEAGIDKATLRAIASRHGLSDLAELPAQPCLSSRVETGIGIEPVDLAFIDRMELAVAKVVTPGSAVRCRITKAGVALELAESTSVLRDEASAIAAELCVETNRSFLGARSYRQGSAFIKK